MILILKTRLAIIFFQCLIPFFSPFVSFVKCSFIFMICFPGTASLYSGADQGSQYGARWCAAGVWIPFLCKCYSTRWVSLDGRCCYYYSYHCCYNYYCYYYCYYKPFIPFLSSIFSSFLPSFLLFRLILILLLLLLFLQLFLLHLFSLKLSNNYVWIWPLH